MLNPLKLPSVATRQDSRTCKPSVFVSIAFLTKAVVAICVVFVPELAVGAVGVPVKVGFVKIVDLDSYAKTPEPVDTIKLLASETTPKESKSSKTLLWA